MTTFNEIGAAAATVGLGIVGAFHPGSADGAPEGTATLVLLGPTGSGMWQAFAAGPEASDGRPDPLDRWSARVVGRMADLLGAGAVFPFGGPPWAPFQRWAALGEGAVASPVGMQVTAGRGLWASYRGALAFAERIALPAGDLRNPCRDCDAPCLTACPVSAFASGTYDVPACTKHVTSQAGEPCRTGCRVRAVCPAGRDLGLPDVQRSFHMAAFLRVHAEN